MKPRQIKSTVAVPGLIVYIFYGGLIWGMPVFLLALEAGGSGSVLPLLMGALFVLVVAAICIRLFFAHSLINRRSLVLEDIAISHKWNFMRAIGTYKAKITLGAPLKAPNAKHWKAHNYIEAPEWRYADFSYDVYGDAKGIEYKSSTIYYAVMSMELPRALPNVLFDSKKARRRQFRAHYDKKQLHSLEGNFDSHFATYFVQDYTIDSLSFITPEVMEKLIDADAYDIEIIDNQVLLYGALVDAHTQIDDMESKLGAVRKALMNNIVTYRDERLPYVKGRSTVAPEGRRLSAPGVSKWVIVALVIYVVARIFEAIFS